MATQVSSNRKCIIDDSEIAILEHANTFLKKTSGITSKTPMTEAVKVMVQKPLPVDEQDKLSSMGQELDGMLPDIWGNFRHCLL